MTSDVLRISQADRRVVDGIDYVEVELYNGSVARVGPGGVLMHVQASSDTRYRMSFTNHWPLEPGSQVFTTMVLPKGGLKWVDFVSYVESAGPVHPLGSRLKFGWVFSTLVSAANEDL